MNLYIERPAVAELLHCLDPSEEFLTSSPLSDSADDRLVSGCELRGYFRSRLTEVSGQGGGAGLTLAFALLRDAQTRDESVLWVSSSLKPFYPPDAHANGVDLARLPVLFLKSPQDAFVALARLLGSGGFGFVVWDLASWKKPEQRLPLAFLGRLNAMARHHRASMLVLTDKAKEEPSLGCLVSLRLQVEALHDNPELLEVEVVRDKRGVTGQKRRWEWRCGLPDGLPSAPSISPAVVVPAKTRLAG